MYGSTRAKDEKANTANPQRRRVAFCALSNRDAPESLSDWIVCSELMFPQNKRATIQFARWQTPLGLFVTIVRLLIHRPKAGLGALNSNHAYVARLNARADPVGGTPAKQYDALVGETLKNDGVISRFNVRKQTPTMTACGVQISLGKPR